jgi:type II secretory pathway pseudopilin PulG
MTLSCERCGSTATTGATCCATPESALLTSRVATAPPGPAWTAGQWQQVPVKPRMHKWTIVLITLVCIPFVLMIVGVVLAVAIPVFINQTHDKIEASMRSDAMHMAKAQETYLTTNPTSSGYPVGVTEGSFAKVAGVEVTPAPGNSITVTVSENEVAAYCVRVDNAKVGPLYYDPTAGGITLVACD